MKLTGAQYKELSDALLNAFTSHAELSMMVRLGLNVNLEHVVSAGSLVETTIRLILWAEARGIVDQLIKAAVQANPNNPALQSFVRRWGNLEWGPQSPSEKWIDTGLARQGEGAYDKALEAFRLAAETARSEQNNQNEARALQLSAGLYRDRGQLELAIRDFEDGLRAAAGSTDNDLCRVFFRELGSIYSQVGDVAKAILYFKKYRDFSRFVGNRWDEATALQEMARLYNQSGADVAALPLLEEAADLWKEVGDLNSQALAASELAAALLRTGDDVSAEAKFRVALDLARQAGSKTAEAAALSNLGQLALQRADYASAEELFRKALALFEQLNDRSHLAATYSNLGRTRRARGQLDEAIIFYRQSLSLSRRLEDQSGEATAIGNIGAVLVEQGNLGEAVTMFRRALRILRELGDSAGIAQTRNLLNLIQGQSEQGKQSLIILVDEAHRFFKDAGFLLNTTGGINSFICEPVAAHWKSRLTSPVYTAIIVGETLNGKRVREVRDETSKFDTALHDAFIVVDKPVEDSAWLQIAALRADGFQAMPIPLTLFYEGKVAAQPHWERMTLSRHLTRFLGEGNDPYDVRSPVFDVLNFFGREALADSLIERLGEGKPIGLFGLRKMGKSSLMRYLQGKLPYPSAWLDLQAGVKLESVFRRILRAWNADARTRFNLQLDLDETEIDGEDPSAEFVEQTRSALDFVAAKRREARLAVFLDEVELMMPPANASGTALEQYLSLLRTLRGLAQEDGRLSLMVAGIDPAINRASRCGAEKVQNPFFKLLQEEFIPPLIPADCIQMVRNIGRQAELSYSDEAARYVAEASGGHPSLARQLCSLAFRRRGRQPGEVTSAELHEAADQFLIDPQYASFLDENGLWGDVVDEELWGAKAAHVNQDILVTLAKRAKPVPLSILTRGPETATRRQCLSELRQLSLISEVQGRGAPHSITFSLFRSWIRQSRLGLDG